jgi:acetolactate synthase-1/2/3 large subunit
MLAIETRVADFARTARHLAPIDGHRHGTWARDARADYEADQAIHPSGDRLDLGQVMAHLRARMPADGILTVDAGNFSGWPQRYLRFGGNRRLLGATNGAMGYGVPAAIAAKLAHPERLVIAAVGDGGFGMTGQELSTAVARGAAIIVLVFNNGLYGTIRMHQERAYPGRPIATDLANPDYAALARAAGALGFTVERTDGFAPAFADAVASGRPAVIELRMDPARISTRNRLATPGD